MKFISFIVTKFFLLLFLGFSCSTGEGFYVLTYKLDCSEKQHPIQDINNEKYSVKVKRNNNCKNWSLIILEGPESDYPSIYYRKKNLCEVDFAFKTYKTGMSFDVIRSDNFQNSSEFKKRTYTIDTILKANNILNSNVVSEASVENEEELRKLCED